MLDTLFELLAAEPSAGVQAVLGHFFFGYLHPYSDGNGRIGRFMLNAMLAAGGYPWTVIRVAPRQLGDALVATPMAVFRLTNYRFVHTVYPC